MYEELVKRLRSHNGWALNKTLDDAADAIEGLSGLVDHYGGETGIKQMEEYANKYWDLLKNAPRWIPVTEELPEEKTNVLIWADTIIGEMAKVSFLYKDEGRNCWTGLDVYGLKPCDWQPTHWMPLPEPPNEENK